MHVEVV